jgi:hypothetical protein
MSTSQDDLWKVQGLITFHSDLHCGLDYWPAGECDDDAPLLCDLPVDLTRNAQGRIPPRPGEQVALLSVSFLVYEDHNLFDSQRGLWGLLWGLGCGAPLAVCGSLRAHPSSAD